MVVETVAAKGFSAPKRELLLLLKRKGSLSLADIAASLRVTKVAALRHLASLESAGLVERSYTPNGVGRPRAYFRLTTDSGALFPDAYAQMSTFALKFIEERLGRDAVTAMLQERAHEVHDEHAAKFQDPVLAHRVRTLARIRDAAGYMADVGPQRGRTHEMLEHNCPILALARHYPEACEVERRMFQSLLGADVTTTHRVVAGAPVCRFLIRAREGETP